MAATRASAAGVVRWYSQQYAAVPLDLVVELSPEFTPALVKDRTVQAGLLRDLFTVLLAITPRGPRHVLDLQILNTYERVVLAERGTGLMQEIFSGIRYRGVNLLNFGFRLFPVITELDFTAHATLRARKALLVLLETIQWGNIAAVTQRRETGDSDINTNCRCGCW